MRCEEPLGHRPVVEGLWRAAARGRLAHALCFAGPDGVGKFLAAEWFATGLFCQRGPGPPCGVCGACKRVRAGSHADLLVVDAVAQGDESIGVGMIAPRDGSEGTSVHSFLALRAMEGGWRVVLVRDMERATGAAQNALLKTLEEPGENTILVLVTSRPDALLQTIHSRCVRVRMGRLRRELTARVLEAQGVARGDAELFARWSQGAPGAALALSERGIAEMRAAIERCTSGAIDPASLAAAIGDIEGRFDGKTPSAMARARARAFIDLAVHVLADVARAEAGVDSAELAHGDLAGGWVGASAGRAGGRDLGIEARLDACLEARLDVDRNLAPEGPIDRVALALYALSPDARTAKQRVARR